MESGVLDQVGRVGLPSTRETREKACRCSINIFWPLLRVEKLLDLQLRA